MTSRLPDDDLGDLAPQGVEIVVKALDLLFGCLHDASNSGVRASFTKFSRRTCPPCLVPNGRFQRGGQVRRLNDSRRP